MGRYTRLVDMKLYRLSNQTCLRTLRQCTYRIHISLLLVPYILLQKCSVLNTETVSMTACLVKFVARTLKRCDSICHMQDSI